MGSDPSRSSPGPGGPFRPQSGRLRPGVCHRRHHLVGGAEREAGHRPVHVAHDAGAVDHEDRPPVEAHRAEDAVALARPACRRRTAAGRRTRPGSSREAVVALDRLGADGQHRGVDVAELVDLGRVAVELAGAHRRVVARVEHQHHRLARRTRTASSRGARPACRRCPASVKSGAASPTLGPLTHRLHRLEDRVGDVEVGVHGLDVVVVVEGVDQAQHLLGALGRVERDRRPTAPW